MNLLTASGRCAVFAEDLHGTIKQRHIGLQGAWELRADCLVEDGFSWTPSFCRTPLAFLLIIHLFYCSPSPVKKHGPCQREEKAGDKQRSGLPTVSLLFGLGENETEGYLTVLTSQVSVVCKCLFFLVAGLLWLILSPSATRYQLLQCCVFLTLSLTLSLVSHKLPWLSWLWLVDEVTQFRFWHVNPAFYQLMFILQALFLIRQMCVCPAPFIGVLALHCSSLQV